MSVALLSPSMAITQSLSALEINGISPSRRSSLKSAFRASKYMVPSLSSMKSRKTASMLSLILYDMRADMGPTYSSSGITRSQRSNNMFDRLRTAAANHTEEADGGGRLDANWWQKWYSKGPKTSPWSVQTLRSGCLDIRSEIPDACCWGWLFLWKRRMIISALRQSHSFTHVPCPRCATTDLCQWRGFVGWILGWYGMSIWQVSSPFPRPISIRDNCFRSNM